MVDTVEYNIRKEIIRKIKNKIKYHDKGYRVIWQEADGCDEYGMKYWVECINRWSGRDWEIREAKNKSCNKLLIDILSEGIFVKNRRYFIDPKIIYHLSGIKAKDLKLITFEEHLFYKNNYELYKKIFLESLEIINSNLPYYNKKTYKNESLFTLDNLRSLIDSYTSNKTDIKKIQEHLYQNNINVNLYS